MSTLRKILLAMLLVSLTGSAFGAGTFASFNASTTNAASTFATGSIVLSDKVNSGTACYSTGIGSPGTGTFSNGNANAACNTLFTTTASKPGDVATANVEVKNEGNIAASTLTLLVTNGSGGNTCSSADASGTAFHGNGTLCNNSSPNVAVQVKIQETASNYSTAQKCIFDTAGAQVNTTCSTGGTLDALFTAANGGSGIAPLTLTNTAGLGVGASRYFVVTFTLPNGSAGAENAIMGKQTDFKLTWTITQ